MKSYTTADLKVLDLQKIVDAMNADGEYMARGADGFAPQVTALLRLDAYDRHYVSVRVLDTQRNQQATAHLYPYEGEPGLWKYAVGVLTRHLETYTHWSYVSPSVTSIANNPDHEVTLAQVVADAVVMDTAFLVENLI